MTQILITSANGTVGTATIRALRAAGVAVRAGLRSPEKGQALAELGAEVVRWDYTAPETMRSALADIDRLFLVTPWVPEMTDLVAAAVQAANQAGVKFVLRSSGAGANPDAPVALPRQHGIGERLVRESGIPAAVIRPTFFMDNLINYAGATIRVEGAFYGAANDGKVAYISSRDIGRVAAAILQEPAEHQGKLYELTGPQALTEAEAAERLAAALGKPVKYVNLTPDQLAGGLRSHGVPDFMVEGLVFLESVKAQGWAAQVSPAVAQITGRPAESLSDFLRREAQRLA